MNEVTIAVSGGKVVLGPPSRIPLAGSSLHHPIAAVGRIFERGEGVAALRSAWPKLGLAGDARQLTPPEMRRAIEDAGAARRLVALFLPAKEDIVIDLDWYERKPPLAAPQAAQRVFNQLSQWEKVKRALALSVDRLGAQGHTQLAAALGALLDEKTITVTVGMMMALMAAHAYGVGEIADIALIAYAYAQAGTAGVLAIGRIADATIDAAGAKSAADLDRIADRYAEAFVTLGVAFLTGLLTRMMQRSAAAARESGGSPTSGSGAGAAVVEERPASAMVGRRSPGVEGANRQLNFPKNPTGAPRNAAGYVGERQYSGHAFDRMQERGLVPSVVEEAIRYGAPATSGEATVYTGANGVTAIVDTASGRVITVY